MHNHGLPVKNLSDDDIANIIYRSAKAARDQRRTASGDGDGVRFAALRRYGDPNTADQKNQLRDGKVPCADGFMEWAGLKGKNLYADYEFLYSRHHKYFNSPEEVKAAVELVLAKPEQVKDKDHNISFVGFDEVTGDIYRIEINPNITGRANHVRSVFKITAQNYNDIKLEQPRVLQPSSTALHEDGRKTMTISSFMSNNISQNPENAKLGSQQTDAALANTSREYRNASEFYRNIIAKVLNYKLPGEKNPENASSTDKNGPSAAPDGAMEGKRTGRTGRTGRTSLTKTARSLLSLAISENRPALHTIKQPAAKSNAEFHSKKTSPC